MPLSTLTKLCPSNAIINACGNRFWVLDTTGITFNLRSLCDLCFSLDTTDGILLLDRDKELTIMRVINQDGSEVACCGNGLRAAGLFLSKISSEKQFKIKTFLDHQEYTVMIDKQITVSFQKGFEIKKPPSDLGLALCVHVKVPHVVLFKNPECLETEGKKTQTHPFFQKEGVNVNFAQRHPDHISYQTYERGVGITGSCGTGAIATALAAYLLFQTPSPVVLIPLSQHPLTVCFEVQDQVFTSVLLSGAAEIESYRGLKNLLEVQ